MERKILVGLDRTISCFNVLHYLCRLFGGDEKTRLHLVHVVPTTVASAGREWLDEKDLLNMLSSQGKSLFKGAEKYMEVVVEKFIREGLSPRQVTHEVRLSRDGIVRDMVHEARRGMYDALAIGRRGADAVTEMIMGGNFSSIMEQANNIPVWMVDGHVSSNSFLVPVDGTTQTMMVVDHLSFILKDHPRAEITLFNSEALFARTPMISPEDFYEQWTKEWCDEHLTRPDSLFHGPRQLLLDSGFPAERIKSVTTTTGIYPSRQIVRQAMIGNHGTIVMGSKPKGISRGLFSSVTSKVLGMAEDLSVWVVEG